MIGALRNRFFPRSGLRFFIRNWTAPGDASRAARVFATMRAGRALLPEIVSAPKASRITVVAPHPDDEVIGPGGTLLRAVANGAAVTCIYVTDGDESAEGAAARHQEALNVSAKLGFRAMFLGEEASAIRCDEAAALRLADMIRSLAPEALFVPFLLDDNDDHRRVNELLFAALRHELLPARMEIWAYNIYAPLPGNVAVDISDLAERKAEAIRLYATQAAKRDWAHFALGVTAVNSRLLPMRLGARHVESFFVMPLSDYAEICAAYLEPDPAPCYLWEPYRRA